MESTREALTATEAEALAPRGWGGLSRFKGLLALRRGRQPVQKKKRDSGLVKTKRNGK